MRPERLDIHDQVYVDAPYTLYVIRYTLRCILYTLDQVLCDAPYTKVRRIHNIRRTPFVYFILYTLYFILYTLY